MIYEKRSGVHKQAGFLLAFAFLLLLAVSLPEEISLHKDASGVTSLELRDILLGASELSKVSLASCGNGVCEVGESPAACPGDCQPTRGGCGDGYCDPYTENIVSCATDCGMCGNGYCDYTSGENVQNCPADCVSATPTPYPTYSPSVTPSACNNRCEQADDSRCPSDCFGCTYYQWRIGACNTQTLYPTAYPTFIPYPIGYPTFTPTFYPTPYPTSYPTPTVEGCTQCGDGLCSAAFGEGNSNCPIDCADTCGNGKCALGETCTTCALDCGACTPPPEVCGNGVCAPSESCSACPNDCGQCLPTCGDAVCENGEDRYSCPRDCQFDTCGNGYCEYQLGESKLSCPSDCKATCGNQLCEPSQGESLQTCPSDCSCGNGACEAGKGETISSCGVDCGCSCGNGACEINQGENLASCPADCSFVQDELVENKPACGDGQCQSSLGESYLTCTIDCGSSPGVSPTPRPAKIPKATPRPSATPRPPLAPSATPEPSATPTATPSVVPDNTLLSSCGNNLCEQGESCPACADCGACATSTPKPTPPPTCGNGACGAGETCSNCVADCGACPPSCGDGSCNGQETCSSCASDCGQCSECGNGVCSNGETCSACPRDCSACAPSCGDGTCNGNENNQNCGSDCSASCGDSYCHSSESCSSCSADCGSCGDGGDYCVEIPSDPNGQVKSCKERTTCIIDSSCAGPFSICKSSCPFASGQQTVPCSISSLHCTPFPFTVCMSTGGTACNPASEYYTQCCSGGAGGAPGPEAIVFGGENAVNSINFEGAFTPMPEKELSRISLSPYIFGPICVPCGNDCVDYSSKPGRACLANQPSRNEAFTCKSSGKYCVKVTPSKPAQCLPCGGSCFLYTEGGPVPGCAYLPGKQVQCQKVGESCVTIAPSPTPVKGCGDRYCAPDESVYSCRADCFPACGNAVCEPGEDIGNCREDCVPPSECGDGVCDLSANENTANCLVDCGIVLCGNGYCQPDSGEDATSCPIDCGVASCGDGVCSEGEASTCPRDCGACSCGNGKCDSRMNEDESSCPVDCKQGCGNGKCEASKGESYSSCPSDCKATSCGNGKCEAAKGETASTCPSDCSASSCGNGKCELSKRETPTSCPKDCGTGCGNSRCEPSIGESSAICPSDCKGECGNGVCEATQGETEATCVADCGASPCGNGLCEANLGEDPASCPLDCVNQCGNNECEANLGETSSSCPADCKPVCGNSVCEFGEQFTCAGDCISREPYCGDKSCNNGETCSTCAGDCGACTPPPTCGNGACGAGETCSNCASDCGACPPSCGDGFCNGQETCSSCAADCGVCSDGDCSGSACYCKTADGCQPTLHPCDFCRAIGGTCWYTSSCGGSGGQLYCVSAAGCFPSSCTLGVPCNGGGSAGLCEDSCPEHGVAYCKINGVCTYEQSCTSCLAAGGSCHVNPNCGGAGGAPGPEAITFEQPSSATGFAVVQANQFTSQRLFTPLKLLNKISQQQTSALYFQSEDLESDSQEFAQKTPEEICSELQREDKDALFARCQELRELGGFVDNPWKASPRDFCVQERFEQACRTAYDSLIDRAFETRRSNAEKICDYESGVNAQFLKTACQGQVACNSHFSESCAVATKQYADCNSFFKEPDFTQLAKLLCDDFKRVENAVVLSSTGSSRPLDSLPVDIAVRAQAEKSLQDIDKLEISVFAERLREKATVGDYVLYDAFVRGDRAGQLFAMRPVSDAGLDYADIAFAQPDEQHSARASRAADSLTSFYLDPSRGGVYGIASYLAFKDKISRRADSLLKVDDSEASKDFYYKLGLLLAGNSREYEEAQLLRRAAEEMKEISQEVRHSAPAAGDLVSTARLFSLWEKTGEFELQLRREARRKEDISSGFVSWFAGWIGRCGGLCTNDEEYG